MPAFPTTLTERSTIESPQEHSNRDDPRAQASEFSAVSGSQVQRATSRGTHRIMSRSLARTCASVQRHSVPSVHAARR